MSASPHAVQSVDFAEHDGPDEFGECVVPDRISIRCKCRCEFTGTHRSAIDSYGDHLRTTARIQVDSVLEEIPRAIK